MTEYIDRNKLIERLHNAEENYKTDHDYEVDDDPFSDGILSAMFSVNQIIGTEPTADVVERAEYERVLEIANFLSQQHGQKLDSIFELRSKIDKAIEEIENSFEPTIGTYDRETPEHDRPLQRFNRNEGKKLAIEIIKRNIGE